MITVNSKPSMGTTFTVFLPKSDIAESPVITESGPLPTGNERILVIDDEAAVANATKDRLNRLGYQTTAIYSSREALELFRSGPDAYDLVITDQTMPDITGSKLAKELINLRPDILIVLCSGYSSNADAEISKGLGIKIYIMRPLDQSELAITVRSVLDGQSSS